MPSAPGSRCCLRQAFVPTPIRRLIVGPTAEMIARTPKSESESGGRCCWLPRQEREQTFVESSLSFGENCNFSDRTAELIDDEVAQLIERNYRRVKEISCPTDARRSSGLLSNCMFEKRSGASNWNAMWPSRKRFQNRLSPER
jgi:hypothetical protein